MNLVRADGSIVRMFLEILRVRQEKMVKRKSNNKTPLLIAYFIRVLTLFLTTISVPKYELINILKLYLYLRPIAILQECLIHCDILKIMLRC